MAQVEAVAPVPRAAMTRRGALAFAVAGLRSGPGTAAQRPPEVVLRLGSNQPDGSPTAVRLREMAAATLADTGGRLQIDVFANGRLGSDNAMLAELRAERLHLYLAGNNLGHISALSELPTIPFAFPDEQAVFSALDGELGDLIRDDLARNGLHAFPYWGNGFHQITTSLRPIVRASDLSGLKIRIPIGTMPAEFFRIFGAEPKGITFDSMYQALRDHEVDGQTDPVGVVTSLRLFEVQRYLSITDHWWSGFLLVTPSAVWRRIPPDLQFILSRNVARFGLLQRQDVARVNRSGVDLLEAAGMQVGKADKDSFRSRLADFYSIWRSAYGPRAWQVLQRNSAIAD